MKLYQSSNSTQHQPSSTVDALYAPPVKRQRTIGSLFKSNEIEDVNSPSISPEQKVQSELTMCINEPKLDTESDPLKWWKSHEETYPILSKVAKKVFLQLALLLKGFLVYLGR